MKKISSFLIYLLRTHPFTEYLELTISQQSYLPIALREEWALVISSLVPNWNIGWLDHVQVLIKRALLCEFTYNDHVMSRRHFCRTPFQPLAFSSSMLSLAIFTKPWMEMVWYRCHTVVMMALRHHLLSIL